MKVEQLFEQLKSPNLTFASEINSLVGFPNDVNLQYQRGTLDPNDTKTWNSYYKLRLSGWFAEHNSSLLSSAAYIAKTNPRAQFMKDLGSVRVFAQTADSSPFTKWNGFQEVHVLIPNACKQIGQNELGQIYTNAWNQLMTTIKNGLASKQPQSSAPKVNTPKPENIIGKQNSQVEQVINQALASLTPEQRHQARTMLSKSANKLQDLQKFMQQLNRP